jgi:YbbR domain-containing protein
MKLPFDLRAIFSRIWETIVENIGLKLLSFAVALGLYAFIHGAQDAQKSISVDVVATTPPDSARRVLVAPLPDHVRVTIRGPRSIVDDVKPDELGSFQLDLRSGKVDRIEFDPSAIHVPPGVRAEQVEPPSISLRWEDVIIREIPVHSAITGQPAPGFVVKGAPKVEPDTVKALGPRSVIDVVQFARAEAFDVTGIAKEGTYDRNLPLDRPPTRVQYESPTVNVRVEIGHEELRRDFAKVPVQVVGVARGTVVPAEVTVRVEGPPEIVRSLVAEQVVPTIDLHSSGVNTSQPGSAKLPVMVELEGCRATVQPQTAVVRW